MTDLDSVSWFLKGSCGFLKNCSSDIRNLNLCDRTVGVDQTVTAFFFRHEKITFISASKAFSEVLILPIEIILKMIFDKLSYIMIATKLAHYNWNTKSFLISKLSIHVFVMISKWLFVMIAKNWFIFVFISSWSVSESSSKGEVKGNRFEAYVCVVINFSDAFNNAIIESLEFESFSDTGK
jgi:hypothetical protein